jgi:hypothetical protein
VSAGASMARFWAHFGAEDLAVLTAAIEDGTARLVFELAEDVAGRIDQTATTVLVEVEVDEEWVELARVPWSDVPLSDVDRPVELAWLVTRARGAVEVGAAN